ncbi:MAG: cytidylate kinase-like family protein [Spirochaetia bacterium]|nr:cytidylate kinase-like family protein [Spirochaetia bacterium]
MKKIITINRKFGAAGGKIGKKVAERLGFAYVDHELVENAAIKANLTLKESSGLDEKVPHEFGFAQSLFGVYRTTLEDRFMEAQKKVIEQFGNHGRCVIVGRNADAILKEFDDTLHVFVYGAESWRLEYVKTLYPNLSYNELKNLLHDVDKGRRKYCSYYTQREFGLAENYDLCLCSSSLGIEKCVDIICDIAQS